MSLAAPPPWIQPSISLQRSDTSPYPFSYSAKRQRTSATRSAARDRLDLLLCSASPNAGRAGPIPIRGIEHCAYRELRLSLYELFCTDRKQPPKKGQSTGYFCFSALSVPGSQPPLASRVKKAFVGLHNQSGARGQKRRRLEEPIFIGSPEVFLNLLPQSWHV